MRKALNENPVVQVVMLGILGIVVAFLFMTRVMGSSEEAAPPPATTDPAVSATPGVAPVTPAVPGTPVTPAPATAAPVVGGEVAFEAGPGLPAGVVDAWKSGDAVVLLITKHKGIEDRKLRAEVSGLRGEPKTTVFMTSAHNISRYSRIAEGVDVQRVPALVILKPKSVAAGPLPEASISYGLRGPESVDQALKDAHYKGKQLPFHPG